jgi:molecular chaperone HscB
MRLWLLVFRMTYSVETVPVPNPAKESPAAAQCWSCFASLGRAELFCAACGRIQPLSAEVDYFEVFALPRKLRLDTAGLEREFYRLSRRLHPDVYARASLQEQEWSLTNSSLLNDTYRTLKDPVKRTEYLLKLEGIVGADHGGAKKEDRVPADLLEEVFELNMQLDEMRMTRQMGEDDPQLQKDLLAAKDTFDAQFIAADSAIERLWDQWDAGVDLSDEAKKQSAKEEMAALLDRRRYIRNLVNSVNEALGL